MLTTKADIEQFLLYQATPEQLADLYDRVCNTPIGMRLASPDHGCPEQLLHLAFLLGHLVDANPHEIMLAFGDVIDPTWDDGSPVDVGVEVDAPPRIKLHINKPGSSRCYCGITDPTWGVSEKTYLTNNTPDEYCPKCVTKREKINAKS